MTNEETNNTATNNSKYLFEIKCDHSQDEFKLLGRPCELSAFSFVPENRLYEPANRSIYNTKISSNKHHNESGYDSVNPVFDNVGFDNRVHRCDRKHAKLHGLDVWSEEIKKSLPSKSSHEYGKHLVNVDANNSTSYKINYLDPPDRRYARIAKVKSEFYNRNGINDLSASLGNL